MNDQIVDLDSKPKSRPRLFRWSLRYFLLFFTLVSVACGWWITRAQKQKATVAKIQELGGDVEYSISANWLSDLLGVDYVETVTEVRFGEGSKKIEIQKIATVVKQLSSCRSLSIDFQRIIELQLAELQLPSGQNKELHFRKVDFDDSAPDFSTLSTCPQLEKVLFSNLDLNQEHFRCLAQCTNLKTIVLGQCNFEGKFLSELNKPGLNLKLLSLQNCRPEYVRRTISKAGKFISSEPTFNFERGTPKYQSLTPSRGEFPHEEYGKWKQKMLPKVDIFELYGL